VVVGVKGGEGRGMREDGREGLAVLRRTTSGRSQGKSKARVGQGFVCVRRACVCVCVWAWGCG